ncbi:hypothetical protein ACL02S_22255 [Nocardia sp. 004]|uniref:hypothetical protein n=1 Tax=Nocardia sp. 004 TaxID=3385978 RepID=UPI0039A28EF1
MVWRALAPLIAGRRSMRLLDMITGKYTRATRLSKHPPAQPGAVTLFDRVGRTRVLSLDFDAKTHGPTAVTADITRVLEWMSTCGGRAVTDTSTSGGAHMYVPLAHGESVTPRLLKPLLRLLATRCPTLDITHALNPDTGCLTVPGSACREGGYRVLDGSLADAEQAFLDRSHPRLITRLIEHLGGIQAPTNPLRHSDPHTSVKIGTRSDLWEGHGDSAYLRSCWQLRSPIPSPQQLFATTGTLPVDGRWPSRSEARQSLLTAAALRGFSLTDIRTQLPYAGGNWHGFANSYSKYGINAERQLLRDWTAACHWTSQTAPLFRVTGHKNKHTGGDPASKHENHASPSIYARWLAYATAWADAHPFKPARRSTVLAVLQALAYAASLSSTATAGTPTVEFGIRSISLAAGLMPRTTVADTLAELRDLPGAPILRIRRASGSFADRYALVTPRLEGRALSPTPMSRIRVVPIHDSWQILGLRCRRIYELITTGLTCPADLFAAAHTTPSSGYDILDTLATAGLITRTHNEVTSGSISLDDLATIHGLEHTRIELVESYQRERAEWRNWLLAHETAPPDITAEYLLPRTHVPPWQHWPDDHEAMWCSVLSEEPGGPAPPPVLTDMLALQLLITELGATVLG